MFPLPAGHIVVWVEVGIDTVARLPDKHLVLVGVVDIPAGMVAGIAEAAVDLLGSWDQTALS